jgi:F-box interacting protein
MLPLLPDDLIAEILSWLPVKPACKFRCVSKGWHALISDPVFVAAHKTRAEPLLMGVTVSNTPQVSSALRLMDVDGNILKVINMAGLWTFNCGFDGPCCFTRAFCTPLKNFVVTVIDLATGNLMRTPEELNIRSFWNLGIGLAVPSRTYKAVGLMREYGQQPSKVLIMEDGAKWRQMQSLPTPSLVATGKNKGSPVTIGGVMHFLYKLVNEYYVIRFDLESEEWKTSIKGPTRSNEKQEKTLIKCMVKLNDALCMVQRSSANIWLIWLLTDPTKGTWVKLYTIPTSLTSQLLMPLMVMRDGRKFLFCACNKARTISTLQVYDPLTRTCTHLEKFPTNLVGYTGLCNLHLECFVSPRISLVSAPSI